MSRPPSDTQNDIHDLYRSDDVVSRYEQHRGLTAVERQIVDEFVPRDSRLLDIGIGAGRTTGDLAQRCDYTGIDWSPEMVAVAKQAYPEVAISTGDARALDFPSESFDIVLFSFNGIDSLSLDGRHRTYLEAHRVLRPNGLFIFSSRNPRFVSLPPISREPRVLAGWLRRLPDATITALKGDAFRKGYGYNRFEHDGLTNFAASSKRVRQELTDTGFTFTAEFASGPGPLPMVPWFYYVAERREPT
ncbi:MAG: class I SAM-dependent methyltransferase [Actinomycetes bacterium]